MRGFCSKGFFDLGGFVPGGFVLWGFVLWGFVLEGFCPTTMCVVPVCHNNTILCERLLCKYAVRGCQCLKFKPRNIRFHYVTRNRTMFIDAPFEALYSRWSWDVHMVNVNMST